MLMPMLVVEGEEVAAGSRITRGAPVGWRRGEWTDGGLQ